SDTCTSSPTTTVTGGAPVRPSLTASHPMSDSTVAVAVERAAAFAIVVPVAKAPQVVSGRPAASITQRKACRSSATGPGDVPSYRAFWSQADVSQSAATDTGYAPPTTQPKKRGPAIAMVPAPACRF